MRALLATFLAFFGWLSMLGSAADAAILAQHVVLAANGDAPWNASVWAHIAAHLPFLTWIRPLAEMVLPEGWAGILFGLPALGYFPARILFSVLTGGLALAWARRLRGRSPG